MVSRQRFIASSLGCLLLLSVAAVGFAQTTGDSSSRSYGGRALAAMVAKGNGVLPVSIRQTVADKDNILAVDWPKSTSGAHRTTLYSFGSLAVTTEKFVLLMQFKPHMVLVTDFDMEDSIPSAEMGSVYRMMSGEPEPGLSLVVTDISPGFFTLVDQSGEHAGSVTCGAFRDSGGELWLFEECVGEFFTSSSFFGLHNDRMVEPTRNFIEVAMKVYLPDEGSGSDPSASGGSEDGSCPSKYLSTYVVGVNHHVDTDFTVYTGDVVTITASGTVTLGFFAGDSGPEGIQFNSDYSYFPDALHGCLIGRVRTSTEDDQEDPWAYIGFGDTWVIEDDGYIQFNLNDNDPDNNVGELSVEIVVCRRH